MARNAALKRRTLPKPAAKAISAIERPLSTASALANRPRCAVATCFGEAPTWCLNRRRSARSWMPTRAASAGTLSSAASPAPISSSARRARPSDPSQPGPGASSGRQRRHGR
jgi:hypothetical protein